LILASSKDLVRVKATVTEHSRTAKVIVFKKKRRKNYKRKKGMFVTQSHHHLTLSTRSTHLCAYALMSAYAKCKKTCIR